MNSVTLAVASIRSRALHSTLCAAAVAAGIALLCSVFLFSQSVADGFSRNAAGIDLVVGTKGSPLQMVLSSVYHADIPAGNIEMRDYEKLKRNPRVKMAIPLALGDNYKGFRMVGTTPDYLKLYKADFASGEVFAAPFETVVGSGSGLSLGDKFAVSHGLAGNTRDVHDGHLYTVTGVLKPTGTVLDKLLITDVKSVQELHGGHDHDHQADSDHEEGGHHSKSDHDDDHNHDHNHDHENEHAHKSDGHDHHSKAEHAHSDHGHQERAGLKSQITTVLIKVRSPLDLMNLPRQINAESDIMAAVPSYEMARFVKNLGVGRNLMIVLGAGFIILSSLMLLASLASGLALRRYDLAVLRVLGATSRRLSATVLAEALIISGIGAIFGVLLGHVLAYCAVISIESLRGLVLPEALLIPRAMDVGFILIGLVSGLVASLVPSITAARTDIAGLLARGRG